MKITELTKSFFKNAKVGDMFLTYRDGVIVSLVQKSDKYGLYRCKCSDHPDDCDDIYYDDGGSVVGCPSSGCGDMRIKAALTPRKKEPQFVPFTTEVEAINAITKHGMYISPMHKGYRDECLIITWLGNSGIRTTITDSNNDIVEYSYERAFEDFSFADGTPFGLELF